MVTTASPDTYHRVIEYGLRKTSLRFDRLLLQAFMAGVYIGLAGQACNVFAGGTPTGAGDARAVSKSVQKFMYAAIFPTAFIAIIFTGAELFTGNTMTMLICLIERRITLLHLLINWVGSFLGNWLGALFAAYFLSFLPGGYDQEPLRSYMCHLQQAKLGYGFGSCFLRGVGCNALVCLAVWNVTGCDDPASKVLALWFPIVTFCVAGYEHIIANFYTLQLTLMMGCGASVGAVVLRNFVPTFLGNMVGGCVLIGAVYWYNFYPVEEYTHKALLGGPAPLGGAPRGPRGAPPAPSRTPTASSPSPGSTPAPPSAPASSASAPSPPPPSAGPPPRASGPATTTPRPTPRASATWAAAPAAPPRPAPPGGPRGPPAPPAPFHAAVFPKPKDAEDDPQLQP